MKHVNDDMRGMINKVKKLQQFESINSNNLNLTDWNSVVKWIEKYGPEQLFDEDGQLDWDHKDTMTGDDLETLIHSYMEKYKDTIILKNINFNIEEGEVISIIGKSG
jgi:ABC-type transport system involved in cytochrome bd biosynthesis fused ATPase/permease subunit